MFNYKKLISAAILTLTASAFITGCGSSNDTSAPVQDTAAESGADAESGAAAAEGAESIRLALILPGSISDASWNAGAYSGLDWLIENEPGIQTAYVENIGNEETVTTVKSYIDEGYNVIFGFGSEFTDYFIDLAISNPDVYFIDTDITTQKELPSNMTTISGYQGDASYVVGALAARLSKSGRIGTVEGFESADLSANTENFIAGARSVNPDIEVINSYVGSWSDVEKARQTTLAQIEYGVDFVYASGDAIGIGIIKACGESGVYVVGYGSDLNELAPEQVVTSVIWNTGVSYKYVVDDIIAGTFSNTPYIPGLAEGAIYLADFHGTISDELEDYVADLIKQFEDGTLKGV